MLAATRRDEVSSGTQLEPAGSSKRQRLSEGRWQRDANKEPPQTHSTNKPLCISMKKEKTLTGSMLLQEDLRDYIVYAQSIKFS